MMACFLLLYNETTREERGSKEAIADEQKNGKIANCKTRCVHSLTLMREVDFCVAKRRRERMIKQIFNSIFSPSVSRALNSSIVRGSQVS